MNSGLQGNNSLCYLNANQVKSVLLLDEIGEFSWELYCEVRGVSREMLNRTGWVLHRYLLYIAYSSMPKQNSFAIALHFSWVT